MAKTLPGLITASGPIYFGYTRAQVVSTALCFMGIRELARKATDKSYPARTVVGTELAGEEAALRSTDYLVSAISTFVTLGPYGQGRFIAELVRYIGHHRDATGLEGLLITVIQSSWPHLPLVWATTLLEIWERFASKTEYAKHYDVIAFDEPSKRIKIFKPGQIESLRPERALPRKYAEASKGYFTTVGQPDFKGVGSPGAWGRMHDWTDIDYYGAGLNGESIDFTGPGGWDGSSSNLPGHSIGGYGSDLGKSRPDFRNGSPQPGEAPGFGNLPNVPGLGSGSGLFGKGNPFHDKGPLSGLYGPGGAFRGDGPFSESFIGRPGPNGPEAFDGYDAEAKAKTKLSQGESHISLGNVLIGSGIGAIGGGGLASLTPNPASQIGGRVVMAVGAVLVILGGVFRTIGADEVASGNDELAAAKRQQDLEKEQKEAAKKEAEKKEAEKKAEEQKKIEEDKKSKEKDKNKKTDPKKKEAGIYPDPYGDGGGVNWSGLSQLPVGDGEGGGGPVWLEALPTDDGIGIGPNRTFLPVDDNGGGSPRPTSVASVTTIGVAGPGLKSLLIQTSASTAMLLGMPKLRSDGSISDAGLLTGMI